MAEKSLKITLQSNKTDVVSLGQVCKFDLVRANAKIETRAFIRQQNIRYLKPLTEWNVNDCIHFFPESPGSYTMEIQWRGGDGSSGWDQYHFCVIADREMVACPTKVDLDKDIHLWAPSEWEAKCLRGYEQPVFDLLSRIVRPGQVIFDIGASLGQFSIWFSRAIGEEGYVYCFEANPLCIYWLQVNLELNKVRNCEILPIALGEGAGSIPFTINYGNSALGVTSDSPFYDSKIGHVIGASKHSLDELAESFHFDMPDIVKIDVEGAEDALITGMENTISRFRPVIVLEVHGFASATNVFKKLANLDYSFNDIVSNRKFNNADELLESFPDAVRQFLCTPRA